MATAVTSGYAGAVPQRLVPSLHPPFCLAKLFPSAAATAESVDLCDAPVLLGFGDCERALAP